MSKEKGHFKGRVIKIEGSKIIIDTNPDTREFEIKNEEGKLKRILVSRWDKPDFPKIGDVVRGIFHRKDSQ